MLFAIGASAILLEAMLCFAMLLCGNANGCSNKRRTCVKDCLHASHWTGTFVLVYVLEALANQSILVFTLNPRVKKLCTIVRLIIARLIYTDENEHRTQHSVFQCPGLISRLGKTKNKTFFKALTTFQSMKSMFMVI